MVAPNVPGKTISAAGMLKNYATDVPSIVDPRKRPARPAAIPIAEAALKIFEQIESPSAKDARKLLVKWRGEQ